MLSRLSTTSAIRRGDCRCLSNIVYKVREDKSSRSEEAYIRQPGSEPLEELTVGALLERAANQWPQREAVVSLGQNVRLSYADLLARADRFAAGLRKIGLRRGDRIGVWSPNYYEWILSYTAAARLGLLVAGINPHYVMSEIEFCLEKVGATAVLAPSSYREQRYADMLLSLKASGSTSLEHIIIYDEDHVEGTRRFRDVEELANKKEIEAIKQEQSTIAVTSGTNIQFTSGTTGRPKAVVLSHRSLVNNAKQVVSRFDMVDNKICLNVPYFHAFGMICGIVGPMHVGSTVVLESPSFSPTKSIESVIQEKCDIFCATPTMWITTIDVHNQMGAKINSLRKGFIGGAFASPNLYRRIRESLGLEQITTIYGLTEATGVIFQSYKNEPEEFRDWTVGNVSGHLEVKVIDEKGNTVPFDTPGELCVRGYSTMLEYYKDPESTRKAFTSDKWLKTGDQFLLQRNGHGRIIGRLKDIVIRGGENIFPAEIEAFLEGHPAIMEAHVIGVHDEVYGEEVCALVRLRAGSRLTAQAVKDYARGKIAKFKVPRYVLFRENFPKTASGKIQKFKLRAEVERMDLVPKRPDPETV